MTDQNMVKGDAVYPNHLVVDEVPVKAALVFVKGEFATIDAAGYLVKMTTTKIKGLVQVRNAVTGGSGDGDVTVSVHRIGTRVLASMPINAKKGDLVQINGSNGTGNLVVSSATVDTANLAVGRVFGLYKNAALIATAADLGLVDMGVY